MNNVKSNKWFDIENSMDESTGAGYSHECGKRNLRKYHIFKILQQYLKGNINRKHIKYYWGFTICLHFFGITVIYFLLYRGLWSHIFCWATVFVFMVKLLRNQF